jgi:voltage-gated potassium channel
VTRGLSPFLEALSLGIWGLFVLEFLVRLTLAPRKLAFLRRSWLTLLSLLLPALRVVRVARVVGLLRASRATRGLRLVKVLSAMNRGMRALGASMARRGLGYVLALTAVVLVGGAAGIYAFEREEGTLTDFGSALWWTAMVMTTLGSEYWPRTPEGRLLCLVLALYALAMFGYITAALATFFVGRDAESAEGEIVGTAGLDAMSREIALLREEIRAVREELKSSASG